MDTLLWPPPSRNISLWIINISKDTSFISKTTPVRGEKREADPRFRPDTVGKQLLFFNSIPAGDLPTVFSFFKSMPAVDLPTPVNDMLTVFLFFNSVSQRFLFVSHPVGNNWFSKSLNNAYPSNGDFFEREELDLDEVVAFI